MENNYRSKNLDHLGIVSQICDEIGIVEIIDRLVPPDPAMKISHGECIQNLQEHLFVRAKVSPTLKLLEISQPTKQSTHSLIIPSNCC
jgi:hypothetical protein